MTSSTNTSGADAPAVTPRLAIEPNSDQSISAARCTSAARVQVLHQAEEERQVLSRHALLVERENEIAAAGMDEKIRVLDPFRDALVGEQLTDVVIGEKGRKLLRHHVGIDRHVPSLGVSAAARIHSAASVSRSTRGSGKNMSSSAVVTVCTSTE